MALKGSNYLTVGHTIALVDWLRANKNEIANHRIHRMHAAELASKELKFKVTQHNLGKDLCSAAGITGWSRAPSKAPVSSDSAVVVNAVYQLYRQVGAVMPDDFRVVCHQRGLSLDE